MFRRRIVAGGFVLNGVGEMAGLTQAMEWGYIETPILLTNSLSVGRVLSGVVSHMVAKHPEIGTREDVVLPVVGEADDSFLNDTRVGLCTARDAQDAIEAARERTGRSGLGRRRNRHDQLRLRRRHRHLVEDLRPRRPHLQRRRPDACRTAAGCGTSRSTAPWSGASSIVGIRPKDVGTDSYGSAIVVVATDVPLLASQLCRLAKRAALGLGRVGSYAASTSGEIVVAFSTGNRVPRSSAQPSKFRSLKFVADPHINTIYEAVIEATEEAVLNAMFCSVGASGRDGREAPPIPQEQVLDLLGKDSQSDAGR